VQILKKIGLIKQGTLRGEWESEHKLFAMGAYIPQDVSLVTNAKRVTAQLACSLGPVLKRRASQRS